MDRTTSSLGPLNKDKDCIMLNKDNKDFNSLKKILPSKVKFPILQKINEPSNFEFYALSFSLKDNF